MSVPREMVAGHSGSEHPCDGVWRPLDPFVRRASDPWSACPEGFTGFTVRWSTIAGHPRRWESYADALEATGAALRIDLDDTDSTAALRGALEHQPELIKLYLPAGMKSSLEAATNESSLVLGVRGRSDAAEIRALISAGQAAETVMAFGLESYDEDQAAALGCIEGLALFSPGLEFASAYRRGATAFEGSFGLLGPAACTEAVELAESSAPEALQLERRLQRFVEGAFDQAARSLSPDERAVALAETFAFFEEEGGDPPKAFACGTWHDLRSEIDRQRLFPDPP